MNLSRLLAGPLLVLALSPAFAVEVVYTANLTGAAEDPPNASPATGTVRVTVDFDTHVMQVESSFADLLSPTTIAHIHCCTEFADTGSAGPATQVPSFTGFPVGVTSGVFDQTLDLDDAASWNPSFITEQGSIDAAFAALTAAMASGHAYFNIHTEQFAGGEIRGFLHAIPEPQTYALMLLGLGAVGWAARRRKG